MKQEEIELLIKDISARLTCGLKCKVKNRIGTFFITDLYGEGKGIGGYFIEENRSFVYPTIKVMPYLRQLSSMTEDEKEELQEIVKSNPISPYGELTNKCDNLTRSVAYGAYDITRYLLSKHFDIIGLIEKGLALEAPDGMYKK